MKTVYVLGAGASKGVIPKAPLNNNLLPWSLALLDKPERITFRMGGELQRSRLVNIKRFISDFYFNNRDVDMQSQGILPPIEDVLSQLDYAIAQEVPFGDMYSIADLRQLKDDLLYALFSILDYRLRAGISLMRDFLRRIDPEQDVIVSLNYDLIVDNAALSQGQNIHYGFTPRIAGGGGVVGNDQPAYRIYKPHGSLNWLYCPTCNAIDVYSVKMALAIYDEGRPEMCRATNQQHAFQPVVITPTFLKSYNNPYIEKVWQATEDALSQAEAIVFIGYSLPAADIMLRTMLLRSVYIGRHRHGHPCRIAVVDKPATGDTTVYENYRRLFGEVTYYDQGFEFYVRQVMEPAR